MTPFPEPSRRMVRCAIYTRKSSEEGLEQDFNSLDAQREACAAYILSQASEGWNLIPDAYDDGGISGGTLVRPALQRLLADVKAGRIDTIVVYKVDRLTRSLLDFSKLVEAFDASGTSFVSVTQSFNTTTSMGRLTLNMLLSFAQFEREVTAERIRDKIAASKARGMWMGGTPPLGYAADGRSLAVVEDHADIVRHIFQHYLALGAVRPLADELERDGIRAPVRTTAKGNRFGGGCFSRGQLYAMLRCATYIGEIHHHGRIHQALHTAIIDRATWEAVQAMLVHNRQGEHRRGGRAQSSLLAGKVLDADGQPLVASHAAKGKTRYRYYVSRDLQTGDSSTGMRIPAPELEAAVLQAVGALLADPLALAATAQLPLSASALAMVSARAAEISAGPSLRQAVQAMVTTVRIQASRIEIDCATADIAAALRLEPHGDMLKAITVTADVRLTRSGRVMRLIQPSGAGVTPARNTALIRLLVKARAWWATLRAGELDITMLAAREGVQPAYITRVLRLAFLAPAVTEAILAGTVRPEVDVTALTLRGPIAPLWGDQVAVRWCWKSGQEAKLSRT